MVFHVLESDTRTPNAAQGKRSRFR
jgi:hypothetical protein